MKNAKIKTKDGRITKISLDKIVALDFDMSDNYISVETVTGSVFSIYFEDADDLQHLDDISDSIISGGVISAKTIVVTK